MIMEKMEQIKEKGYVEKNEELTRRLAEDVTKNVAASDVQEMVKELINLLDEQDRPTMDMGKNYWSIVIDSYLHNSQVISGVDKRYGAGASHFWAWPLKFIFIKCKKEADIFCLFFTVVSI